LAAVWLKLYVVIYVGPSVDEESLIFCGTPTPTVLCDILIVNWRMTVHDWGSTTGKNCTVAETAYTMYNHCIRSLLVAPYHHDKELIIKRYINSPSLLYLLLQSMSIRVITCPRSRSFPQKIATLHLSTSSTSQCYSSSKSFICFIV